MKIKAFINNSIKNISKSLSRFPAAVAFLTGIAVINILLIYNVIDDLYPELLVSFVMAAETGLLLSLADEGKMLKVSKAVSFVISACIAALAFMALHFSELNDYVVLGAFGIILALGMLIMVVLYKENDDKPLLAYLIQSGFYCGFAVLVGYIGLIICILAFYYLIYSFEDLFKIIAMLSDLAAFAFAMMFLSYLPDKDSNMSISKSYSSIFNKIGFGVYLLLIAVLYVYIGKIVITWQFPVGRLNWFGSLALLFYVLFYLGLVGEENEPQKLFVRYGGILLIPILAIQLYAIYIRVSAYGLTTLRYTSLLMILFAVLFIINSVIRRNQSWVFAAGCVIALLGCIGPLNIIDLPNRNQEARMYDVIDRYHLVENGRYVYRDNISEEDMEKLLGSYDYLKYSDGSKAERVTMITELDRAVLKNEPFDYQPDNSTWIQYSPASIDVDISRYKRAVYVVSYEAENVGSIDMTSRIMEIYKKYGDEPIKDSILMIEAGNDRAFLVQELSVKIINEKIEYFYIEGFLLIGGEQ